MARTRPYANDVERFAIASGMIGLTPSVREHYLDFDLAADAAWEDFQREVGINPFLAESSDTTRYYDSQGGNIVQIHPYFTITSVTVKGSFDTTSTSYTQNTQYLQWPDGDPPIKMLIFDGFLSAGPRRVGVTGRRGWTDDLPARVFQAVCGKALINLHGEIAGLIANGALAWTEGDVSEKHGEYGAFSASMKRFQRLYDEVTAPEPRGYRQVQVYGAGRL